MSNINLFILCFMLIAGSCSKHNVNIKGIPKKIEVEAKPIDLRVKLELTEASALCNERFGVNTDLSNKCFMSYLTFFKINISLDTSSILEYCENRYDTAQLQETCEQDLLGLLTNIGRLE